MFWITDITKAKIYVLMKKKNMYIYIYMLLNVKNFLDILFIHGGKLIEIIDCYRCMF